MTGVSCAAFKIRLFTVNAIRMSADQNRDLELRPSNPDATPGSEKRQYQSAKQLGCLHGSPESQGEY